LETPEAVVLETSEAASNAITNFTHSRIFVSFILVAEPARLVTFHWPVEADFSNLNSNFVKTSPYSASAMLFTRTFAFSTSCAATMILTK
jgi:hypothetical protein